MLCGGGNRSRAWNVHQCVCVRACCWAGTADGSAVKACSPVRLFACVCVRTKYIQSRTYRSRVMHVVYVGQRTLAETIRCGIACNRVSTALTRNGVHCLILTHVRERCRCACHRSRFFYYVQAQNGVSAFTASETCAIRTRCCVQT